MPALVQSTLRRALQVAVILSAVCFLFAHVLRGVENSDENELAISQESIIDRNERSTPRSFILPATPAVAFEQEAQMTDMAQQFQLAKCTRALIILGHQLEDRKSVLNAKLVEAVYAYQAAHSLPTTGRLDQQTMEMLKCT